ncbi:MAG: hypothetical protein L0Y79_12235 [Chlorobi bacterium]|nr:hypothetical protein [Chlorobiota bacterium]MCI0715653.1 hypothetical protein [Chlorobiota bacterium]
MKDLVIKYFLPVISLLSFSFAQDISIKDEDNLNQVEKPSLVDESRISIIKNENEINQSKIAGMFLSYQLSAKKTNTESFNIVSSFRSNVRFGGFWEKYAIINFTPQMQLKPWGFISIHAHHNISCFVPIKGVKQHFKPLAIQGAAVMAVETSLKFLVPGNSIIKSIIGFVAKNLIISYMMGSAIKKSEGENRMLEYDYYHYSVSIRF